jgi:HEAT repeat protein
MSFLAAIWWLSVAMASISIMALAKLIIERIIDDRRTHRTAIREKELSTLVFRILNGEDESILGPLSQADLALVGKIFLDLLGSLKGREAERIAALMQRVYPEEYLLEDISSEILPRRLRAIDALAYYRSPRSDEALLEAARRGAGSMRIAAARAILTSGRNVDIKRLIAGLDVGVVGRSSALRGTFAMIGVNHTSDLIEVLEDLPGDDVKVLAIRGLRASGDYRALRAILPYAGHGSANVRAGAIRALGEFQHPDGAQAILAALEDVAWEVRTQAATAVGRLGLRESIPKLKALLVDEHWWVQLRASQALARLGEAGIDALKAMTRTDTPAAKIANMALRERGLT